MNPRHDRPRARPSRASTPHFAWVIASVLACGDSSGDDSNTDASSTGATTDAVATFSTASAASTGESSGPSPSTGAASEPGTESGESGAADSSTGGDDPLTFAGEMDGFRWELPCADPSARDTCPWDPAVLEGAIDDPAFALHRELQVVFGGDPAVVYDVTIRIRGLAEPKNFADGEFQQEHFQIGGTPSADDYNIYGIDVTDPAQSYTVNRHETPHNHFVFVMDYSVTIPIRGGASVTMKMLDPNDIAIANPGAASGSAEPYVVPEIPPFPDPFFGQFIQMDVISVVAR